MSVLHDRYSRAGNCIGLPSKTDLLLSTSLFWRRNFVIEVSHLRFSSPSFSILDNRA